MNTIIRLLKPLAATVAIGAVYGALDQAGRELTKSAAAKMRARRKVKQG